MFLLSGGFNVQINSFCQFTFSIRLKRPQFNDLRERGADWVVDPWAVPDLPIGYVDLSIGVREGILLGGRKKFALKVTSLV